MLKLYKIVLFSILMYACLEDNNDSLPSLKGKNLVFSYLVSRRQYETFFILYSFQLSVFLAVFQPHARTRHIGKLLFKTKIVIIDVNVNFFEFLVHTKMISEP